MNDINRVNNIIVNIIDDIIVLDSKPFIQKITGNKRNTSSIYNILPLSMLVLTNNNPV